MGTKKKRKCVEDPAATTSGTPTLKQHSTAEELDTCAFTEKISNSTYAAASLLRAAFPPEDSYSLSDGESFIPNIDDNDDEMTDPDVNFETVSSSSNLGFENDRLARFFGYVSRFSEVTERLRGGVEYLVKRSQCQSDLRYEEMEKMHTPEGQLSSIMHLAHIVYSTPRQQRGNLAKTIRLVHEIGCEHGFYACGKETNASFAEKHGRNDFDANYITKCIQPEYNIGLVTGGFFTHGVKLPLDESDMRRQLLEGKFSIMENLPVPTVHSIAGHAYVDPLECCRCCLAWPNAKLSILEERNFHGEVCIHSSQSKRAREIFSSATAAGCDGIISYLTFWSDDCDAGSTAMQGNANMWVLVMTVATPIDDRNRVQNSFPIAVGKKGDSHEAIYFKIAQALNMMKDPRTQKPFYIGWKNKLVPCYFETLAWLGDQPERRGENKLMLGSSTYHARFGVSADHLSLYRSNRLQSCEQCIEKMKGLYNSPPPDLLHLLLCDECLNWDALSDSPLANVPCPEKYPKYNIDDDPRSLRIVNERLCKVGDELLLKPFRITYDSLKEAVRVAHAAYLADEWDMDNCKEFLKVEGINSDFLEQFREHAEYSKAFRMVTEGESLDYLLHIQQQNPALFQRVPYPWPWSLPGVDIISHVEAIMHIFMLGIVKDCVMLTSHILTRVQAGASLLRLLNPLSKLLISCKNNSWLKPREYKGGKLGGWISENYLALARVSLWFYKDIGVAMGDKTENEDVPHPADADQQNWRKDQNKYWLEVRGLDTSGKANELRARVAAAMLLDPVPEPVPPPNVTAEDIADLWISLNNLLASAMSRCVDGIVIAKAEIAIRLYLSTYDRIEQKAPAQRKNAKDLKKPAVVSAYNNLCLLNIPRVMEEFGPLPDLWEGGIKGEGFLPQVKALYHGGMRDGWTINMLKGLHRAIALRGTMSPLQTTEVAPSELHSLKFCSSEFHQHTSKRDISDRLLVTRNASKKPISVILLHDAASSVQVRIFSAAGNYNQLVEIYLENDQDYVKQFGLSYYNFKVAPELEGDSLTWSAHISPSLKNPKIGFAYLLPLMGGTQDVANRRFAMIASTWRCLGEEYSLQDMLSRSIFK
jgi:hypothetical protein